MSSAGRSSPGRGAAIARAATFVLPTVSVLVAALVFVGPGARRPAAAARVRGLPADGARVLALRVEVIESLYDVVDAGGDQELLVEGSAPGQTLRAWHGHTGPDGIAEVRLEGSAPVRDPVALSIVSLARRPKLLAGGEIALGKPAVLDGASASDPRPKPRPLAEALAQRGHLEGTVHGDLAIRVEATRGFLAAPFPEVLRVRVSPLGDDGPLGAPAAVELSGAGLTAVPDKLTADERGVATFQLTALAHQVELGVAVRSGDKSARWEGTLPVVPGAIWISPTPSASGARAVLAPAPRDHAYVSFWSEEGRVAGAVVPLARDAQGFYAGELSVPDLPAARVLFASVAGDPLEQGAGTIAWPIQPAEGAVTPRPLALLLDGLPGALDRETQRAWVTRRAGLEAHLAEASGPMPAADRARLLGAAREYPLLRAALAVALVGLGFALVAALATFR
jgi:hypothetical protein